MISEKIKGLREQAGLSQSQLAKKLDDSRKAASEKVLEKNKAVEAKFNG